MTLEYPSLRLARADQSGRRYNVRVVDMLEAKRKPSRLEAVESGAEREIVIARNGRPAAKLVQIADATRGKRIGVAKGKFELPDDIDLDNGLIDKLFTGKKK